MQEIVALWGSGSYVTGAAQAEVETELLRLDSDKAANRLGWQATYTWREALRETVRWFKVYQERAGAGAEIDMRDVCVEQIVAYTQRARELGLAWAQ